MKLQNVVIPTNSFSQSLAFYRDVLLLPVVYQSENSCFLNAGTAHIAIHAIEQDNHFTPTGHGYYLDFLVDDMAHAKERLVQANVVILREWLDNEMVFLLIADPDGNRLELYSGQK